MFERLELLPDLDYSTRKSHIHHLIYLIDDKHRYSWEIDSTTLDHIQKTTRSGDNHLGTITELFDLATDRKTTKNSKRSHTHITREIHHFFTSLHSELTGWFKDENLWLTEFWIDTIECRNHKCSSLTRTSIRLDDDIFAIEGNRNHGSLYLSWLSISEFSYSSDDLCTECKVRKVHRKRGLSLGYKENLREEK